MKSVCKCACVCVTSHVFFLRLGTLQEPERPWAWGQIGTSSHIFCQPAVDLSGTQEPTQPREPISGEGVKGRTGNTGLGWAAFLLYLAVCGARHETLPAVPRYLSPRSVVTILCEPMPDSQKCKSGFTISPLLASSLGVIRGDHFRYAPIPVNI